MWFGEKVQEMLRSKNMRTRTTIDCWRFFVDYGNGWEHEITEFTREDMQENRKAYAENCQFPVRIKRGRMKRSELSEYELSDIEARLALRRKARCALLV